MRKPVFAAISAFALSTTRPIALAVSTGGQGFADIGSPYCNTANINTSTAFTIGNLISTAASVGYFAGLSTQILGPISFSTSVGSSFSFGNATFGAFSSTSIREISNTPGQRTFLIIGTYTAGTFNPVLTPNPASAEITLAFSQSPAGSGAISDSATLSIPVTPPAISSVSPASGIWTGGFVVAISGTRLTDGTLGDVTAVTLAGTTATVTGVSGSTQVLARAQSAAALGPGPVVVRSTSGGEVIRANAFTYNPTLLINGGAYGTVSPSGVVEVAWATGTNVVATADRYCRIASFLTNGAVDPMAPDRDVYTGIWSIVTSVRTVDVSFAQNIAPLGTPEWWMAQYGLTNNGQSFEEAEISDTDNDGLTAAAERMADTVPTNAASVLRLTQLTVGDSLTVGFWCTNSRLYSLLVKTNPAVQSWQAVPGSTNQPGEADGHMTLTDTNPAPLRAYRIGVRMP